MSNSTTSSHDSSNAEHIINDRCNLEKVSKTDKEEYQQLTSHKIIKNVINNKFLGLNIRKLSKYCESTYTGLWYPINGKRKWNADLWLTVLCALGAVEVRGHTIIIHTEITKDIKMKNRLNRYYAPLKGSAYND